jgi:hypothetical protein
MFLCGEKLNIHLIPDIIIFRIANLINISNMGYYIDLSSISMDDYKTKLQLADMIPSRMILKDRLDERFGYFKSIGLKNILELKQMLNKKDKFAELSKVECLKGDYLTILLRELNSMLPKSNKIKDFVGISADTVSKLEKKGIKDTLQLFDKVKDPLRRKELADTTGISDADIMELTKLTDLSRIKWAGVSFARMLYDVGIDTVEKVLLTNYEDLHRKITRYNKEKNFYKGQIGLHDMKLFVAAAKEVPLEIEY